MSECSATLTWKPYDGEWGREESERTEHCDLEAGHVGYHHGPGGAFEPWVPDAAGTEAGR